MVNSAIDFISAAITEIIHSGNDQLAAQSVPVLSDIRNALLRTDGLGRPDYRQA